MPNFELHADYNRDGIINLNSAEYNLRNSLPGAILTVSYTHLGIMMYH